MFVIPLNLTATFKSPCIPSTTQAAVRGSLFSDFMEIHKHLNDLLFNWSAVLSLFFDLHFSLIVLLPNVVSSSKSP